MRDVDSILEEAGRQWRSAQPEPARLDPVLFAQAAAAPARPRLRLDRSFLAGAAGATVVVAIVAVVASTGGLIQWGGTAQPGQPTGNPSVGYIASGLEHCPLTTPDPAFTPPPAAGVDWSRVTTYGRAWHGSARLWTWLPPEGEIWMGLPETPLGLGQKTFWWRDGYNSIREPVPEIYVSGVRLDGPGRLGFGRGTHAGTDLGTAMLVGIEIPEPGCWELTARYGRDTLSIVVWVGQ